MKVLITGIAGFIGYHLALSLLKLEYEIVGVDNVNDYYDIDLKKSRLSELGIELDKKKISHSNKYKGLTFHHRDICDQDLFKDDCFRDFDYIVHLAAQAGVRYSLLNPISYIDNNIKGFVNILEFSRKNNIALLYASSSSVYGNSKQIPFNESDSCNSPLSVYAMSKRSNELLALTYNNLYDLKSIGFRFFTVYGPYGRPDMAPYLFTKAAIDDKEVQVYNYGNQYRDFTFIQDIVDGIITVITSSRKFDCEVYNLGKGSPISLGDFIFTIEKITKIEIRKKYIEAQSGDTAFTFADMSNFMSNYNYTPKVELEEGLKIFIDWYKNYHLI